MSNVRVCVDVVGGDEKPQVVLDGIEAALAADPDIEVLAAGPAEIVNPFAASHARVEALEAPDVIAMDDDPIRAVMTKRKSSIVLSCRAIKKGNADAFFSAGSTGAMTAAATAYKTCDRLDQVSCMSTGFHGTVGCHSNEIDLAVLCRCKYNHALAQFILKIIAQITQTIHIYTVNRCC